MSMSIWTRLWGSSRSICGELSMSWYSEAVPPRGCLFAALHLQILRHLQVAQAHGLARAELHGLLALAGDLAGLLEVGDLLLHSLGQLDLALVEQAGHGALELLGRPTYVARLEILERAGLEL